MILCSPPTNLLESTVCWYLSCCIFILCLYFCVSLICPTKTVSPVRSWPLSYSSLPILKMPWRVHCTQLTLSCSIRYTIRLWTLQIRRVSHWVFTSPTVHSLGLGIVMPNAYLLISTYWNIFKKYVVEGIISDSVTDSNFSTNRKKNHRTIWSQVVPNFTLIKKK